MPEWEGSDEMCLRSPHLLSVDLGHSSSALLFFYLPFFPHSCLLMLPLKYCDLVFIYLFIVFLVFSFFKYQDIIIPWLHENIYRMGLKYLKTLRSTYFKTYRFRVCPINIIGKNGTILGGKSWSFLINCYIPVTTITLKKIQLYLKIIKLLVNHNRT